MKKLLAVIVALTLPLLCCAGCGNYDEFDVSYKFTKAYVKIGEEWQDIEVKSWTDYEGEQLQLKLKDGTVMVVSSVNCILYEGTLPIRK
jgi:hypothetical protein